MDFPGAGSVTGGSSSPSYRNDPRPFRASLTAESVSGDLTVRGLASVWAGGLCADRLPTNKRGHKTAVTVKRTPPCVCVVMGEIPSVGTTGTHPSEAA